MRRSGTILLLLAAFLAALSPAITQMTPRDFSSSVSYPHSSLEHVLILYSVTFHHGGRIAQLLVSVGCRLLYLPSYGSDLHRIAKC
jgi:O-antigen ligase